jgi:hypothetical protein
MHAEGEFQASGRLRGAAEINVARHVAEQACEL